MSWFLKQLSLMRKLKMFVLEMTPLIINGRWWKVILSKQKAKSTTFQLLPLVYIQGNVNFLFLFLHNFNAFQKKFHTFHLVVTRWLFGLSRQTRYLGVLARRDLAFAHIFYRIVKDLFCNFWKFRKINFRFF